VCHQGFCWWKQLLTPTMHKVIPTLLLLLLLLLLLWFLF
jgi:hypothetical protein